MTLALPGIDDRDYWLRRLCRSLAYRHAHCGGSYGRRFYTNQARMCIDALRGRAT